MELDAVIQRMKPNNKRGLTLLELAIALTIIGIFAGLLMMMIWKTTIVGKEEALRIELKNLRMSIVLHKATRRKYPEDLKIFFHTKYNKPMGSDDVLYGEEFLKSVGKDEAGYPVDPFGNRFYYNPRKGTISSATRGYENW